MIWIKRIILILIIPVIITALILLFVSKDRICNLAMSKAAQNHITMCYDTRNSTPVGCKMKRITLLLAHSPVARVKNMHITPFKATASDIILEGASADILPAHIRTISFFPISGTLHAEGDFGNLTGKILWSKRKIRLYLVPSSLMRRNFRQTMRMFHLKNKKYIYVTSF